MTPGDISVPVTAEQIKQLASFIMHKHYCENDVYAITPLFTDPFSWIARESRSTPAARITCLRYSISSREKCPPAYLRMKSTTFLKSAPAYSCAPAACGFRPILKQGNSCACISAWCSCLRLPAIQCAAAIFRYRIRMPK